MTHRTSITAAAAAALTITLASPLAAQPDGPHAELTPLAGYTFVPEDLTATPAESDLFLGGRLAYFTSNALAWRIEGGFTATQLEPPATGNVDVFLYGAGLTWFPLARPAGGPYLALGGGGVRVNVEGTEGENHPHVLAEAGMRFFFSDLVGISFGAQDAITVDHAVTSVEDTDDLSHVVSVAGGITFALGGKPRDTDGDGVSDRKDACPGTPRGATVDLKGCPSDSDGDGVLDGIDQCADTPKGATVDARGCPSDADGDGVFDGIDQCADTPKGATVDARGCPSDADGDGVLDGPDQCANTPKGAKVDAKGCPSDADGDGVFDGLDLCPDTPKGLQVDPSGCPIELIQRETELLDTGMLRLQDVNFETGKADVLPESFPALDQVGQILSKWAELRIEVGGHTDARGSAAYNQRLSDARARAVLDYLVGKFPALKGDQFSARGYGESKPVASNANALGMAKNRRVEFVVLNKDVLKKVQERRELLKKGE